MLIAGIVDLKTLGRRRSAQQPTQDLDHSAWRGRARRRHSCGLRQISRFPSRQTNYAQNEGGGICSPTLPP